MGNEYNLGTRTSDADAYSSGIAYVCIPSDVSREVYIAQCYKTSTVSIYSEHNGWTNRVPVGKVTMNYIEFPDDKNSFGSAVGFVIDPIHKHPIVFDVFSTTDEVCDLAEKQYRLKREQEGNFFEISGSPKNILLKVNSESGGEIAIIATSDNDNSIIKIESDGSIETTSLGANNVTSYTETNSTVIDKNNIENVSSIKQTSTANTLNAKETEINTGELRINEGVEPFILGGKWKEMMDDFIDELSKITVTTAIGQMPILNKVQVIAFKEKTEAVQSQIAFLDS